jgi:hypothetical protein
MLLWNHWGKGHYVDPGLAAFVIPEINGADSCDPNQHQDGGEQGEYDQRSPPKRLLLGGATVSPSSNRLTYQWLAIWTVPLEVKGSGHKLTQISCTLCTGTQFSLLLASATGSFDKD